MSRIVTAVAVAALALTPMLPRYIGQGQPYHPPEKAKELVSVTMICHTSCVVYVETKSKHYRCMTVITEAANPDSSRCKLIFPINKDY